MPAPKACDAPEVTLTQEPGPRNETVGSRVLGLGSGLGRESRRQGWQGKHWRDQERRGAGKQLPAYHHSVLMASSLDHAQGMELSTAHTFVHPFSTSLLSTSCVGGYRNTTMIETGKRGAATL